MELIPQDIAWLVEVTWGTPFVLQAIARKKEKCPERSVQAIVPEVFDNIEKLLISDILPAFSEEEIRYQHPSTAGSRPQDQDG